MTRATPEAALLHSARHLADVRPELTTLAHRLVDQQAARGHTLVAVQGVRTEADQQRIYAQGRTSLGPSASLSHPLGRTVTNAAHAEDTAHGRAAALDFAFLHDGRVCWCEAHPWLALALDANALGLTSGAEFGQSRPGALDGQDKGHVELQHWRALPMPAAA